MWGDEESEEAQGSNREATHHKIGALVISIGQKSDNNGHNASNNVDWDREELLIQASQ